MNPKSHEELVAEYGYEAVEFAENFVEENKYSYQDEFDRNYP